MIMTNNKDELEKLKQKYKDLNEKFVSLEIDNEEFERRNQAYESAIENCEEKIDSLLEEIALTQSERDDTKACLSEQIEKLNQQLEELQMDIQYKDKQIKKYKFLHILHDYPTSANEILNKATHPNKTLGRNSTILPNSARNRSSEDFAFFNKNKPYDHRKSDFMIGPLKPSLSILANQMEFQGSKQTQKDDLNLLLSPGNPFQKEINECEARVRRKSTDLCELSKVKKADLFNENNHPEILKKSKAERGNSADLLPVTNPSQPPQNITESKELPIESEKPKVEQNEENEDYDSEEEGAEFFNKVMDLKPESKTDEEKAIELTTPKSVVKENTQTPKAKEPINRETIKAVNSDNDVVPQRDSIKIDRSQDSKWMTFGSKKQNPQSVPKVSKTLTDIDALLEYDGDDIDQLAMSNSKDALRIMDSIEEMIESRIRQLKDSDQGISEMYNENFFGLACY